jgi:apolipoprotein N-acyltransferase
MKKLWPWLCALASGGMLALCFAPVDQGGFAWFALTPLIAAIWFSEPCEGERGQAWFIDILCFEWT